MISDLKFIHYHPDTLVINNIEFDHADIFADIEAIKKQFQHLLKIIPANGKLIVHADDSNIIDVINRGCWTPIEAFSSGKGNWKTGEATRDFSRFEVIHEGKYQGTVTWSMVGEFNAENALAAIASANDVGVSPKLACEALSTFSSVKTASGGNCQYQQHNGL